jgi:hypothetical protein
MDDHAMLSLTYQTSGSTNVVVNYASYQLQCQGHMLKTKKSYRPLVVSKLGLLNYLL